jgi:hypothetical protein
MKFLEILKKVFKKADKSEEVKIEKQRAEQKRLEEIKAEELKAKERKIVENERLKLIHKLYSEDFKQYLIEAQKFRDDFGKNVKCDVCGKWEIDLSFHQGQTYCERCIPSELQWENERKVRAGRHGASQDFIKK